MKTVNPDNPRPFRRMCLVVIGYILAVYFSFKVFIWTVDDIMATEPGAFIMMNALLAIVLISLLVLVIDEINDYINN